MFSKLKDLQIKYKVMGITISISIVTVVLVCVAFALYDRSTFKERYKENLSTLANIIGTNNVGKSQEICDLLPKKLKKYFPKEFNILSPEETGKNFEENSLIKASYFSKKTNLICLSDDSGLEIDLLKGKPGIYSSRWAGTKSNFDAAIRKVYEEMSNIKKDWKNDNSARFVCCMTLFWPDGKNYSAKAIINGKIASEKKGSNGFG